MSISRTVQYQRIDDVIKAYENNDIAPFAISSGQGKQVQLLFVYEADNMEDGAVYLGELLEQLQYSAAIYTICFYKVVPPDGIDSKTPFRNSFNFQLRRLKHQGGGVEEYGVPVEYGGNRDLVEQVKALTATVQILQARLDEPETEQEPENKLGMLGAILDHPAIAGVVERFLTTIGAQIAGALMPGSEPGKKAAVMNGVNTNTAVLTPQEKLDKAVGILANIDTNYIDNLLRLALIAQRTPEQYEQLKSMLLALQPAV